MGYLRPSHGDVFLNGESITNLRSDERIRRGLAYVAQTRCCFSRRTVRENLRLGAFLVKDKALREERRRKVLERFPELRIRMNEPASVLSGGQLRMLELGRFLMMDPTMVILDEPSIGLSPQLVDLVYRQILELRQAGMTFLIVEQNVKKLLSVADHCYALENGTNRYDGSPADLTEGSLLAGLYLGEAGRTGPGEGATR